MRTPPPWVGVSLARAIAMDVFNECRLPVRWWINLVIWCRGRPPEFFMRRLRARGLRWNT